VVVRNFWDILRIILGGQPESDALGNSAMQYVIVETDGSIQPVDTLRVCEDGMIEAGLHLSQHGFDNLTQGSTLFYTLATTGMPLCKACRACPVVDTCGGGYPPHRYSRQNGFDNPSAWCPDLFKLLNHVRSKIEFRCTTLMHQ
jgi:uncharacterized protein